MNEIRTRQLVRRLIKEMFNGQWDKATTKTKGRRYIPTTLDIPRNLINKLNDTTDGPHIKVITNEETKQKVIIVSSFLKIALEQSQRGRTSRDTEIYKNKLLKRFNEIFEGHSMFKVVLKKSLEDTKSRETPWGTFFTSRLSVPSSTPDKIVIRNPSVSGMASGLDEKIK